MSDAIARAAQETSVASASEQAEEEALNVGTAASPDKPAPAVSEAGQGEPEEAGESGEANGLEEEGLDDTPVARKVRQSVTFEPENEPYEPGRCTVFVSLTIRPSDENPEGRQVLIAAGTHSDVVEVTSARLNYLALPGPVVTLIERCELSLVERGKVAAERKAKARAARKTRPAKGAVKQAVQAPPVKPAKKAATLAIGAAPPTTDAGQPSLF
jgi:hypothetical protein